MTSSGETATVADRAADHRLAGMGMTTVFRASHADTNDGQGDIFLGLFARREDAVKASQGYYVQNVQSAPCGKVAELAVYGTFQEYWRARNKQAQLSAWEKLSPEEREAVGLTSRPLLH